MEIKLTGLKEVPAQSRKGSYDWGKVEDFFSGVVKVERAKKDKEEVDPVQGADPRSLMTLLGSGAKHCGILRKAPKHCSSISEIAICKNQNKTFKDSKGNMLEEVAFVTLNI